MDIRALSALAVGLLTFGSGCMLTNANKTGAKKPDVTQPGVLPSPQEAMKPASAVAPSGNVIQAGGIQPAGQGASVAGVNVPSMSSLAKLAKPERKIRATEMAVAWRNRVAYLPDPTRNGAMGAGLAGQLFLYGGEKLEFALADGTLTVDLVDETPRPAGQAAARPERWQFDKRTLRNLRTVDETFGKSYVLFLPWPAYKADITKVRISARYDPDSGNTLYATPSVVSIDTSAPFGTQVWDGMSNTTRPVGAMAPGSNLPSQQFGGTPPGVFPGGMTPIGGPIPLGGSAPPASSGMPTGGMLMPSGGAIPLGGAASTGMPRQTTMPAMPAPPTMSLPPGAGVPTGALPMEPLPPIGITVGPR